MVRAHWESPALYSVVRRARARGEEGSDRERRNGKVSSLLEHNYDGKGSRFRATIHKTMGEQTSPQHSDAISSDGGGTRLVHHTLSCQNAIYQTRCRLPTARPSATQVTVPPARHTSPDLPSDVRRRRFTTSPQRVPNKEEERVARGALYTRRVSISCIVHKTPLGLRFCSWASSARCVPPRSPSEYGGLPGMRMRRWRYRALRAVASDRTCRGFPACPP